MALSATFTANFSSFYDAVDKAEIKLKEFGAGAENAGKRLSAMGNQFSGVKIIQDATLMVKAIEDIGGTTKLTEKELAKLGATANEAVAKMKALGMDVPKNLQKIADETKNAGKATTDWMGTLTKVAGAVGIAFSVDAVVGFVGSVFEAASAVKDLGNQWGFSTQAVQKWTGAAKDSGITTQALGKSVQNVTEQLVKSDEQYEALLKNIGLSGDALRKMKSEDAYKEVLEALTAITDETLQYDMALAILGPSAKEVIGGIRDGLVEATDAQITMSDETIKRLADASDAWGKLKNNVIIYSGEMLAAVMDAGQKMTRSWTSFFTYAAAGLRDVMGGSQTLAGLLAAEQAIEGVTGAAKGLGAALAPVASHGDAANATMKTAAQIAAELKAKKEALAKQEAARAKALAEAKRIEEQYTAALKKHDDALDDLVNSFGGASGSGAIGKANLYLDALKMAIPIEKMSVKAKLDIHKAMDEAIVSYQAAGQMAPKVMYDIWLATRNATEGVIEFSSKWLNFAHIVAKPLDLNLGPGFTMADAPALTMLEKYGTSIRNLSLALGALGQQTGGGFGEILTSLGGVAGGLEAGRVAAEGFGLAMKEFKPGGDIVAGVTGTATAIAGAAAQFLLMTEDANLLQSTLTGASMGMALAPANLVGFGLAAGAVAGYIRGLHNEAAKSHELQEMKTHAILAAGGLENLSNAAIRAGTNVNALMSANTGGEISRAMEDLNAAFEYQQGAVALLAETVQKYGFELSELGPAMQRQELDKRAQELYRDFMLLNEAGIESVAITGRMADAVNIYVQDAMAMGMEVPSAMRPMLEAFAKSGELMDENGDAITDLEDSGINFAMTMSDGFKALIEEVKKLAEAISRDLTQSVKDIPQPRIEGVVTWTHATPENVPRPNDRIGGGAAPEYAKGTDGFKNFGAGTPVILHGWEAVVPRDQANATVTGGGGPAALGGGMMTVIVEADGRQLSRIVAPFLPGEVRRLGLARG